MTDEELAWATVRYRVRFEECTPEGTLRAAAYLRYAQDAAWINSERLGYDRAWYARRRIGWLVRGIRLVILEPSRTGDELSVTTRVVGYRRVWARRRTDVHGTDGRLVAWAYTDWVMTDARGLPTRVPPEFPARFSAPPGTFIPTKVTLQPAPGSAAVLRSVVRPHELDPMGHANNAAYLEWVDEAVAALDPASTTLVPRRYRLEYLIPVPPGTRLVSTTWPDGDGISYRLTDEAGIECFRARLESATTTAQEGDDRESKAAGMRAG